MKYIKSLIIAMTIFSVTFHWGAYASVLIAFIIVILKKPGEVLSLLKKQKLIALLGAALLMSIVFSKALGNSILAGGILLLHLMAFIVLLTGTRLEDMEELIKLLNITAIFVCLYGLYQYYTGNLTIDKSWTDTKTFGSLIRIYSTLRNPNIFAGYLGLNICFAAAYWIRRKRDMLTSVNIVLSSICLILTYSRGGFMAFLTAMLVLVLLFRDWKAVLYLAIMSFLYYRYNTIGGLNRADLGLLDTDSSSLYRLEIWKASFGLFRKNIISGSGPGSVMEYLSYSTPKLKGFIAHSHNIYIHLLAETGIAGLTAFLLAVFVSYKKFIAFWRKYRDGKYAYIAAGFAASMSALLAYGLVDCVIFIPTRSIIFLIYLSLFPILLYNMGKKDSIT